MLEGKLDVNSNFFVQISISSWEISKKELFEEKCISSINCGLSSKRRTLKASF